MTICANPDFKKIRVSVGNNTVILKVRNYSQVEFQNFMGARYQVRKKGVVKDNSIVERIKFIDSILIDISAEDENGNPDIINYIESGTGNAKELTSMVENWVGYVNPSWKVSAALTLEETDAELVSDVLKN